MMSNDNLLVLETEDKPRCAVRYVVPPRLLLLLLRTSAEVCVASSLLY